MKHRWLVHDLIYLLALALTMRTLTALPLQHPGYMDAFYYVEGGRTLYQGHGFDEFMIWNYLDAPESIPHPGYTYWMPLTSILVYLGFILFGPTFRAAQMPFVLLTAMLPLIAYAIVYRVNQCRRHAWYAGLLTVAGGFYLIRWPTPDNFGPFALAGSLCLWMLGTGFKRGGWGRFVLAGLCAGLAHLSRSDGVLLLIVPLPVMMIKLLQVARNKTAESPTRSLPLCLSFAVRYLLFALGYLLTMLPWFIRNVQATGMLLPSAGTRTLWLTDYDNLFSYGKPLSPSTYLAWGWDNILRSKVQGLWLNLQTLLIVGWMIALAPFGLIGVWRLRRRVELAPAYTYGLLLYLTMSLGFTYPGIRGAMFHSTPALLPFLFAAATDGLDAAIAWVAARRHGWHVRQAQQVLGVGLMAIMVLLSGLLYTRTLPQYRHPHPDQAVAAWMAQNVPAEARVLVGDPAAFRYWSGRECLVIPNDGLEILLQVAERYDVAYLVVDKNAPQPLRPIYDRLPAPFILLQRFEDQNGEKIYLYRIEQNR